MRVKVARVDLETTKIDFTLAEDAAPPESMEPGKRAPGAAPASRTGRPGKRTGR